MNRSDCFAKADAALKEKIAKNRDEEAQRVEKLYKQIPRLREIEDELKANISEFAAFAFSGNKSEEAFNKFRNKSLALQAERSDILTHSGLPQNAHERRFYCEKCKDVGYTDEGTCECFKRELSKQMLENSNLSAAYREKTFANFDLSYYSDPIDRKKMKLTLEYAKKYVKNFKTNKENLLFMGRSGSGKTYISCAIGIALAEAGNYVCYVAAQDMISEFEAEKFGKGDKASETRRFYDADLLIIDDLGSEFRTQFSESVIYNVVNSRLNSQKPMIISTNFRPAELSGEYHERIVSRLLNEFLTPVFADVDVRELKKLGRR